jgi:5-methylcytosine-specific restriction endonuclease McrA
MARSPGRTGHRWRRLVTHVQRRADPCWLCGHPIDWDAEPRTPKSFSVDHIVPLSLGGDPLDPANAATAHYGCNSARQNKTVTPRPPTSRAW